MRKVFCRWMGENYRISGGEDNGTKIVMVRVNGRVVVKETCCDAGGGRLIVEEGIWRGESRGFYLKIRKTDRTRFCKTNR